LGDPAMLLPKVYTPTTEKKYKLGIIPHMVDYDIVNIHVKNNPDKFPNTIVIDPNTNTRLIEFFIDRVNECEKIVATCLHGIICAHAYGIPAKWMKIGDRLCGDDVKFHDHFESVGIFDLEPMDLIQDENVNIPDFTSTLDIEKLWNCRPWLDVSDEYYVDLDNPDWVDECYFEGYKDRVWTDGFFKLN
jgi:pyruvyltransferase